MNLKSISIEGRDYWLVPKDKAKDYPGSVDALAFAGKAIGKSLRDARTKAGLTQAEKIRLLRRVPLRVEVVDAQDGGLDEVFGLGLGALAGAGSSPDDPA